MSYHLQTEMNITTNYTFITFKKQTILVKRTILMLGLLAALGSCKKSPEIQKKDDGKLPTDIKLTITNGNQSTDLNQQGDATYNFLGYGYDITDQYNDASSVRSVVINIPSLVKSNPYQFDLSRATTGYWENYSGETATDLAGKLSQKFDETSGLKVFKNTIASAFPGADTFNGKYVYGYYSAISVRMRMRIVDNYNNVLNSYVTDGFSQDVNTLTTADLVKKYGTHMLRSIAIGSRLNVVYQAEAPSTNRKMISSTGLRYAMKTIFGLATGELDPMDLVALNANTSAKVYFYAVGGDQSTLKESSVNNRTFINPTEWFGSTTEDKARFIGAAEDGLIPLYDLITDVNKKAVVKAYIIKYIQDNQL
ncbi:MAC/perforin domain-containing protein [Mucilaginibacter sp. OK098]|uniref:MAC/perforin domain-containing protein n=1 Tax=Mucilaginibacter sp. OK098 TaxID=1855297 RepID=UPI0009220B18|nr:MAC/perforin domain-containing protein [Mucilaginibacter sp. OK098]SHM04545.1 MAC/Perforin domain-containing protein [Mucilaginibacter sp. OK098]